MDSTNSFLYNKTSKLLHLYSCPYLGIYDNQYEFLVPISIYHKENSTHDFKSLLPNTIIQEIENEKVPIESMVININSSDLIQKERNNQNNEEYKRMNLVLHSYIFHEINNIQTLFIKDQETTVINAMFTDLNSVDFEKNVLQLEEKEAIQINPNKLMMKQNESTVILHYADGFPALSPNNNAFLFNLNSELVSFTYVCCVSKGNSYNKSRFDKILICSFLIINSRISTFPYRNLFNILSNEMDKTWDCTDVNKNKDKDENIIKSIVEIEYSYLYLHKLTLDLYYTLYKNQSFKPDSIKNMIDSIINTVLHYNINNKEADLRKELNKTHFKLKLFISECIAKENKDLILIENLLYNIQSYDKENKEVDELSFNSGIVYLNEYFNSNLTIIKNIIYRLVCFFKEDSQINYFLNSDRKSLIRKDVCEYLLEHISTHSSSYYIVSLSLDYDFLITLHSDIDKSIYIQKDHFILKKSILDSNKINKSIKQLENLLNSILINFDQALYEITLLNSEILDILFYITWLYKGKLTGIHSDFGRHSFLRSEIIPSCYHCSLEESLDIIEILTVRLEGLIKIN